MILYQITTDLSKVLKIGTSSISRLIEVGVLLVGLDKLLCVVSYSLLCFYRADKIYIVNFYVLYLNNGFMLPMDSKEKLF